MLNKFTFILLRDMQKGQIEDALGHNSDEENGLINVLLEGLQIYEKS